MSSQPSRREASRIAPGTLVIASLASASAAVIVSQFWQSGTPLAAAITPVVVALVSEMLKRPTEKISERVTVAKSAVRPRADDPGPEEARRSMPLEPARRMPASGEDPAGPPAEGAPGDVSVYRSRPPRRRPIPVKVVALTGGLAFAIAVAALTLPELIAGQSITGGDRGTTIFAGDRRDRDRDGEGDRDGGGSGEERQGQEQEGRERDSSAEKQPDRSSEPPAREEEPAPAPAPEEEPPAVEEPAPEEEDTTTDSAPAPAPAPPQ